MSSTFQKLDSLFGELKDHNMVDKTHFLKETKNNNSQKNYYGFLRPLHYSIHETKYIIIVFA